MISAHHLCQMIYWQSYDRMFYSLAFLKKHRIPINLVLSSIILLIGILSGNAQAEDEDTGDEYTPVHFSAQSRPIIVAADSRLELGLTGSIEIALTLPDDLTLPLPKNMTVLSIENQFRTRFRVVFTESGRKLGLFDGKVLRSIPYDISNGGFHHIGLSTTGEVTRVYRNGDLIGEIAMGYGENEDLPLYIGGQADHKDSFQGDFHYLRIWDNALTDADFNRTYDQPGLPQNLTDLVSHVVLYSEFTQNKQSVFFTRAFKLSDILAGDSSQILGRSDGESFVDVIPEGTTLSKIVGTSTDRITSIQFYVKDENGREYPLAVHGELPDAKHRLHVFELNDGEMLTGVIGEMQVMQTQQTDKDGAISLFRTEQLQNLSFSDSSGQRSKPFGQVALSNSAVAGSSYALGFNKQFSLDAIYGFFSEGYLSGLGIAPKAVRKVAFPGGLWEPKLAAAHPDKLESSIVLAAGGRKRHGNYLDREILRLRPSNRGQTLEVFDPGRFYYRFQRLINGDYELGAYSLVFRSESEFQLNGKLYTRIKPRKRLPETSDFIPIGGTFSQDMEVPKYEFNYHGYNLAEINPLNFQDAKGQKRNVFSMPDPTSRDYYTEFNKVVPSGLLIALDDMETSELQTATIHSSSDLISSLSNSVGVKVGVPKVFSFSANSKITEKLKQQKTSGQQLAMGEDVKTHYGLVFDPSHMRLDAAFYQDLLRLGLKREKGESVDYIKEIIEPYGTHYANAVTTGEIEHNFLSFSKTAYESLREKNQNIDLSAKATFDNVQAGGKFEHQDGLSTDVNNDLERQVKKMTRIGSASNPVPAFMDLRPLDLLLTPMYFEEPSVYGTVRIELQQAIKHYLAEKAPAYNQPEDIWEPYVFSIKLDQIEFDIRHLSDLDTVMADVGFDMLMKNRTSQIVSSRPRSDPYILITDDFSSSNNKPSRTFQLPHNRKYYIFTASEICSHSMQFSMNFGINARYVFRGLFKNSASDKHRERISFVYPYTLGMNDRTFELHSTVSSDGGGTSIPFTLSASARQEPDISGQYTPMPVCGKS
jgi:concanavalin A-like lectin/glucanase superfamily protein/MAC/Perforin domain-containing protein/jacalin-like lectin domain-containing protein